MNNKTKVVAGAGAGLLAIGMIGGGTFAAWTDFAEINGNESGAGVLTLDVAAKDGSPTFSVGDMVPGEEKEQNIFLVNRDADAVPLADLTMSFNNVTENEDGCTSNSEAVAEGGPDARAGDVGACGAVDEGEFGDQATSQILVSAPGSVSSAADCPNTGVYGSVSPQTNGKTFAEVLAATYSLGTLAPGEGVCLRMNVGLPIGADDTAQGDSISYNVRFDLTQ